MSRCSEYAVTAIIRVLVTAVLAREARLFHSPASLLFGSNRSFSGLLSFGLLLPHGPVSAFLFEELLVSATFDNTTAVEDENLLSMGDRGQAMSRTVSSNTTPVFAKGPT